MKRAFAGLGAVLATVLLLGVTRAEAGIAQYQVTFDATWNSMSHPTDFPPGAHFSPLIGGTHNAMATFWQPGALASAGIEAMAERGSTSPLRSEVQAQVAAGHAYSVVAGGGTPSPGRVTATFALDDAHPLVTLVSMIAPTPDWFVGVHGLDLRNCTGGWRDAARVDLFAYDAGTDDGWSFLSADADSMPHVGITRLNTYPFENAGPLGTFEFKLVSATATAYPITAAVAPEPAGAGLLLAASFALLTRRRARRPGRLKPGAC